MDENIFTNSDCFFDTKNTTNFGYYADKNFDDLNFDSFDDDLCFNEDNFETFPDYFKDNLPTTYKMDNAEMNNNINISNTENENEVQFVPDIDFTNMPTIPHQTTTAYQLPRVFSYNDTISKPNFTTSLPINTETTTNSFHSANNKFSENLNQSTSFYSSLNSKKKLNKNGKPKKKPGRKVKVPDFLLPPEEAQKRRLRRERNKVAAAKCRNKRKQTAFKLEEETKRLEKEHQYLKTIRTNLVEEKKKLQKILLTHQQNCMFNLTTDSLVTNN